MTKTKIIILSLIVFLLLSGIGLATFVLLKPQNNSTIQNNKSIVSSVQSYSSTTKKITFENPKKSISSSENIDTKNNSNSKRFSDDSEVTIAETDLNNYSKARDESLIYPDDFAVAECESYILTVNSAQNCYLTFRKEILESEVPKIRASIISLDNYDSSEGVESFLKCKKLSVEQNPDKNAIRCSTDNLNLQNSGYYNMTLTVAGDVLNNALEKNIEVLTTSEFQQKYNEQVDN
jgi:hypothetical protein